MDEKFRILNREAELITQLLTSGMESLRKVDKSHAYYYQSFYSISMGLERLMKLILHLEYPRDKPMGFRHGLIDLSNKLNIPFLSDSIENKILVFLNDFAKGDRYTIVDYLHDNDSTKLSKEPVNNFYSSIILNVLREHPPKKSIYLTDCDGIISVLRIKENLTEIDTFSDLVYHGRVIEHAAKYSVMYVGRLLRPYIIRLQDHDGGDNPLFREHFGSLLFGDEYFLNRKTYRN